MRYLVDLVYDTAVEYPWLVVDTTGIDSPVPCHNHATARQVQCDRQLAHDMTVAINRALDAIGA